MFGNIFKNIKLLSFKQDKHEDTEVITSNVIVEQKKKIIVGDPIILNSSSPKTLLIVNNTQGVMELLDLNFRKILQVSKIDVKSDYKMVICNGENSGLMAINYIQKHHVDVALIDLILTNIDTEELDNFSGLALADMIKNKNVNSRIGILSSIDLLKVKTINLGVNLKHSLENIDACLTFNNLGSDRKVLKLLA